MKRPNALEIQSSDELRKWYWLKTELVMLSKCRGISSAGSKADLMDRLANELDGKKEANMILGKATSKFNWATEELTCNTIITDSYKNGQNTRKFFKIHCGEKFSFSISFMTWMKKNTGKTLQDAVEEWERLQQVQNQESYQSRIPESNQYNQYLRDFFANNPEKTIQEARYYWNLKRQLPLGKHKYEKSDLMLKEK